VKRAFSAHAAQRNAINKSFMIEARADGCSSGRERATRCQAGAGHDSNGITVSILAALTHLADMALGIKLEAKFDDDLE
jgi:hypothetical protein